MTAYGQRLRESLAYVMGARDAEYRAAMGDPFLSSSDYEAAIGSPVTYGFPESGDLATDLDRLLASAGFGKHDLYGDEGGFAITTHIREDGVLVDWVPRHRAYYEPGSFEMAIRDIVQPAIETILTTCGFAAVRIPVGEDDAGCILVTGLTDKDLDV